MTMAATPVQVNRPPDRLLELRAVHKRFGTAMPANGISLTIAAGEFFTLLGPSGSGKSTVLRIIAGLERADSGAVVIGGRDVSGVPPWRRNLGMVFQQYANFPHLNVAENVGYGLRRKGHSRARIRERVTELLALVGLAGFEDRRVTQLSGGEQQRVSIARALAPAPALLLLDEPLSALDEKIRREMQAELRRIQQTTGTTFVYVTHDQEEALTMSDRIAVLHGGDCVQCDAPETVFRFPRTRFVARFFRGCNVLEGTISRHPDGISLALGGTTIALDRPEITGTGPVALALRGEAILLDADAAGADITLEGTLERVTYRGVYSDYRISLPDGQTLAAVVTRRRDLAAGATVRLGLSADDLVVLQPD